MINLDEMSEAEILELAKNSIAMVSKYDGMVYYIAGIDDEFCIILHGAKDPFPEAQLYIKDIEEQHWSFKSKQELLSIALLKVTGVLG